MTDSLRFRSWVQPRAVAGLPVDDAQNHPQLPADPPPLDVLSFGVVVTEDLAPTPTLTPVSGPATLHSLGPADIVGIDPAQILRRYPAPQVVNAEPANLACLELAGTDLPWRYSPASTAADRLRPWLALVVVSADLKVSGGNPCSLITVPVEDLPDLAQSWAWAHAQLDDDDPAAIRGLARLLCPLHLPANQWLRAVLVPAFRGGMLAGGGSDNTGDPNAADPNRAHEPAWVGGRPAVTLPIYDQWTFRTGDGADFEILAERIEPVRPEQIGGFGSRMVDISQPFPATGPTVPPPAVIAVEAALRPATAAGAAPDPAAEAALADCAATLAAAVNREGDVAVGPPLRGGPHLNLTTIKTAGDGWLDVANRDPRWRLAAGRGADWVAANREDLMAQAWTQAGQIRAAAHRLAIARAGQAVSTSMHRRHIAPLTLDETIRVTAPAYRRMRVASVDAGPVVANPSPTNPSLQAVLAVSVAPTGLGSTPFARLVGARTAIPGSAVTLTGRALAGEMTGLPGITAPVTDTPIALGAGSGAIAINHGAVLAINLQTTSTIETTTTVAGRLTALKILDVGVNQVAAVRLTRTSAAAVWQSAIAPAAAQQARIGSMITGAVIGSAAPAAAVTSALQPVLPTPQVASPMAMALIDRDPDWLVAGATKFPDDRATLLAPDNAFIEAVLLGANDALLREYLWRGFPTDRRGTPVRQFWPSGAADIAGIDTWAGTDVLGSHITAADTTLTFLMIRSALFERYPDTVIVAAPAVQSGATITPGPVSSWHPPKFRMVVVNSRTRIVGFDVTETQLGSTPGWFFALIEPPTGLRFGFEPWPQPQSGRFLDALSPPFPSVGCAADVAATALHQQSRIFLHASLMVNTR